MSIAAKTVFIWSKSSSCGKLVSVQCRLCRPTASGPRAAEEGAQASPVSRKGTQAQGKSLGRNSGVADALKKSLGDLGHQRRGRMTSLSDRRNAVALIRKAQSNGARLQPACRLLGLGIRTFQRWTEGGQLKPDQRPDARRPAYWLPAINRCIRAQRRRSSWLINWTVDGIWRRNPRCIES